MRELRVKLRILGQTLSLQGTAKNVNQAIFKVYLIRMRLAIVFLLNSAALKIIICLKGINVLQRMDKLEV